MGDLPDAAGAEQWPVSQGDNGGQSDMDWEHVQLPDALNDHDFGQDSHFSNLFGYEEKDFAEQQVEEEYSPAASLDRPDDVENQTGRFMVPTPKARADRNLAETVDMDVSRTIDNLVIQHVAGSSSLPSSFLNRMDFDNVFSLDSIWRQPQLPMYGRFESVQGVVHSAVSSHEEPVQGVSDFKRKRLLATAFAKTDDQLVDCAMRQLKEIVLFQPLDSRLGRALWIFQESWYQSRKFQLPLLMLLLARRLAQYLKGLQTITVLHDGQLMWDGAIP